MLSGLSRIERADAKPPMEPKVSRKRYTLNVHRRETPV